MAKCPCGCGERINFMKKRLANHGVDLRVGLPIVQRLAELAGDDEEGANNAWHVYLEGQTMSDAMINLAHGEDVSSFLVPSLTELQRWRNVANHAARAVSMSDPEWWESYLDELDPRARRLAQSMPGAAR